MKENKMLFGINYAKKEQIDLEANYQSRP